MLSGVLRTIRTRVALATCLLLAAVLTVTGLVVDSEDGRQELAALDQRLNSEARALAQLVRFDGERVWLEFEDETLTDFAARGNGAYFQVSTAAGLVERSRSLGEASLPEPEAAAFAASPTATAPVAMLRTLDGPFESRARMVTLVLTRPVSADDEDDAPDALIPSQAPDGQRGKAGGVARGAPQDQERQASGVEVAVEVARSLAGVELAQAQLRQALGVALPLALLVATLGAFLVAQRATRPILRMSAEAGGIAAGALESRIDLQRTDGELLQLGRTINEAFDRLADAAARERRFSADVSHELRTPLAVLRSASELALSRERSGAEYRDALQQVQSASLRMQRLIDELLLLARCESWQPSSEVLDLRAVVQRAVSAVSAMAAAGQPAMAAPDAAAAHGHVQVHLGTEPLPVRGSAVLLQRVVESLVENARRHGGTETPIEVRAEDVGGHVELSVADCGPGFPHELLPRVFERFARGDASRSRESGGAGLGLAIVRAVARAHGGDAQAGPRQGGGARVVVTLPLAAGDPGQQAPLAC